MSRRCASPQRLFDCLTHATSRLLQGWLSKPKFSLEGAIFKYDEQDEEPTEYTKIKQIPSDRLVATFEGSWKGDIRWFNPGDKVRMCSNSNPWL